MPCVTSRHVVGGGKITHPHTHRTHTLLLLSVHMWSMLNVSCRAALQERKELLAGDFKDKHWWWGSLLLASGVGIAIEGCVNTFMRTGRLFPGPHLYAGATIVGLWAAAAALVPAMQKGDNNARQAHIFLNALNVLLFAWQVPTGLEIVGKVFEFTSCEWPALRCAVAWRVM